MAGLLNVIKGVGKGVGEVYDAGKGLLDQFSMDTPSRMARAKEQGFSDTDYYHGTKQDVKEFEAGYSDGLTFFTPNPEFANKWIGKGKYNDKIDTSDLDAVKARQKEWESTIDWESYKTWTPEYNDFIDNKRMAFVKAKQNANKAVYPVKLRMQKTFDPEVDVEARNEVAKVWGYDGFDSITDPSVRKGYIDGSYLFYEQKDVVDKLRSMGYDSMKLSESYDGVKDTIAMFDTQDIRSKFATFDPNKTGSSNILATNPAAAAMALGTGGLLANRMREDKKMSLMDGPK
jgi:hypothetical protein